MRNKESLMTIVESRATSLNPLVQRNRRLQKENYKEKNNFNDLPPVLGIWKKTGVHGRQ